METCGHWLSYALKATRQAEMVCLDPDNGIAPDDTRMYRKEGPKFVYRDDLKAFWDRGQSLVVYHHLGMDKPANEMIGQTTAVLRGALEREPIPLRFRKGTSTGPNQDWQG